MSTQAKIVILRNDYGRPTPFGTFCPFLDTVEGKEYDVLILEPGEVDAEGEMKFVAFNPVGENNDLTLPRVRISPNGDLSMLTDPESPAWQTIGLTITALKKDSLSLAYRNGRPAA